MAALYAAIGIAVGGFALPHGAVSIGLLALGIALSAVIGLARGYRTRVWQAEDGRVLARGTWVTIVLFVGLIAAKFGIGTYEYLARVRDSAGFGEVLVMIGVMVAVQAQIVWIRARGMVRGAGSPSENRQVLETASV